MPTNDSLVKILQKLIASGFEVPIILTGIGANGSIVVGEYVSDGSSGVQFNPLAERQMDGGLAEPVNVLIVDARGRATHVVIEDGIAQFH
jgi:hypothetical protein